jgi:hypothetical protein
MDAISPVPRRRTTRERHWQGGGLPATQVFDIVACQFNDYHPSSCQEPGPYVCLMPSAEGLCEANRPSGGGCATIAACYNPRSARNLEGIMLV